jgi:hypothetical protein
VKERVERPPGAAALLCDSEPFLMLFFIISDIGDKNQNAACFPDAQHALHGPVFQHVTVMDEEPQAPPRDEPFDNQFGAATWRDPSLKQSLTDR